MQVLKTWTARGITPRLVAGVTLAIAATGLSAQELQPWAERSQQRIQRLIEQLGHQNYFVRERAQEELAKLSFEAFDALDAATTHEDLEIAARAKYVLRLMRMEWTVQSDPPEVQRLLGDYQLQDVATKLARMRDLANLPEGTGIPALCRLVRYEQSAVLSKQAAIELLHRRPHGEPPPRQLAELLRKNLDGSRRTAASWLLSWLRLADDTEAAIADWAKLVEAEQLLLGRSSSATNAMIVAKLTRLQIQWLKKLDRKDEAMLAMRRLIDLEIGDPQTLAELLGWLIEQKAWKAIDELAARFPRQFASDPILLYLSAQAWAEQGDPGRAEETARRALELNPGKDLRNLERHRITAEALQQRGLFPWARREYRYVIETGVAESPAVVLAQYLFSEMLHDQGEELGAAEVLQDLAKTVQRTRNRAAGQDTAAIRSRMNFFFACHWQGKKDLAKQREYLDKAIAVDPTDIDALIACYRLPDQTPEYRQRILQLIKKSAAGFRAEINDNPDDPTPCNQFAWLVGNTEGDLDEALRCSQKSIQLDPNNGGYYDTLAHVYFAKGDHQNALKQQTKAAELEPHSGLIAKQLKVFRQKWEEEKNNQ